MTVKTVTIGLAVALLIVFVIGFAQDPFGWRKAKDARQEAAITQGRADTTVGHSADQTAAVVRYIIQNGEKEVRYVQTLPGADTPTDPDRRAKLCAALGRVLDNPKACDAEPDAVPAPTL